MVHHHLKVKFHSTLPMFQHGQVQTVLCAHARTEWHGLRHQKLQMITQHVLNAQELEAVTERPERANAKLRTQVLAAVVLFAKTTAVDMVLASHSLRLPTWHPMTPRVIYRSNSQPQECLLPRSMRTLVESMMVHLIPNRTMAACVRGFTTVQTAR